MEEAPKLPRWAQQFSDWYGRIGGWQTAIMGRRAQIAAQLGGPVLAVYKRLREQGVRTFPVYQLKSAFTLPLIKIEPDCLKALSQAGMCITLSHRPPDGETQESVIIRPYANDDDGMLARA